MSRNGKAAESRPTFDFGRVGRSWAREWQRLNSEIVRLSQKASTVSDNTPQDEQDAMIEQINQLVDARGAVICQVLTDVPREWLIPDAPETIDWHDPQSLEWINLNHYGSLPGAVNEAMTSPKN